MFGIVSCRNKPRESALHTQREIWMSQKKLIIFVTDIDFEQMLASKKSLLDPVEVIRQKIEDFRLKL